ncbi:MAG: hypothetical protein ACTH31_00335 [Pseudoclavibacter sp.]
MRIISVRGLFTTDEQTADWMSRARRPETRARIRRWSRAETVIVWSTIAGLALLVAAPFVTLALIIWFAIAGIDRVDVYWWLWGFAAGLPTLGAIAGVIATGRREKACYADARQSIGRIDRVIEHPGSGDDATWYDIRISAEGPDGVILHRTLHDEGEDRHRRVGARVRFSHNTSDPDDRHDILFEGYAHPDARGTSRDKPRRRHLDWLEGTPPDLP